MKKEYTLVVFDESKVDMKLIKQLFIDGGAVVLSNFPEISFGNLDNFLTEQIELEINMNEG